MGPVGDNDIAPGRDDVYLALLDAKDSAVGMILVHGLAPIMEVEMALIERQWNWESFDGPLTREYAETIMEIGEVPLIDLRAVVYPRIHIESTGYSP